MLIIFKRQMSLTRVDVRAGLAILGVPLLV